MRKNEWFAHFERQLYPLPPAERRWAMEYYRELYADKYEAGMSEEEVIFSFGEPEKAAKEIRENFGGTEELHETEEKNKERMYTPPTNEENETKDTITDGKVLATLISVLVAIALGYLAVIATITMFVVELAFLSAGITLCVMGISSLGVALIFLGLFVCMLFPCCAAVKGMFKGIITLTKKCYNNIIKEAQK